MAVKLDTSSTDSLSHENIIFKVSNNSYEVNFIALTAPWNYTKGVYTYAYIEIFVPITAL